MGKMAPLVVYAIAIILTWARERVALFQVHAQAAKESEAWVRHCETSDLLCEVKL